MIQYTSHYASPLGGITLAADDIGLTGLWFDGQKYFEDGLAKDHRETEITERPIFQQTKQWLDTYFQGIKPDFSVPVHFEGTKFQVSVWKVLQTIPYGSTMTYGEIARQIARERGSQHMSAQAVGNAVGRNKISIIVPCHRVVGSTGALTGYAGGIDRKKKLLTLEQVAVRTN